MKRSYRGPIIQSGVEGGILDAIANLGVFNDYALAVDEATGDITLLYHCGREAQWRVSSGDPYPAEYAMWTVTP